MPGIFQRWPTAWMCLLCLGLFFSAELAASEWVDAAGDGNLERLKVLLAADPQLPCSTDRVGQSALMLASRNGRLDVVKFLLANQADVEQNTKESITALSLAAARGHSAVCEVLLQAGADPNHRHKDGSTPFLGAVMMGHIPTVKVLIASGAKVNAAQEEPGIDKDIGKHIQVTPVLMVAGPHASTELLQVLIDHGADVNAMQVRIDEKQVHHPVSSALMQAVQFQDTEVAKFLIEHKANVNCKGEAGQTPLHVAVRMGCMQLVTQLLAAGADVNAVNQAGQKPIDVKMIPTTQQAEIVGLLQKAAQSAANGTPKQADQ